MGLDSRRNTHVDVVAPLLGDPGDGTHSSRADHDPVVVDERVLVDGTENISTRDVVPDLCMQHEASISDASFSRTPVRRRDDWTDGVFARVKVPLQFPAQRLGVDTTYTHAH